MSDSLFRRLIERAAKACERRKHERFEENGTTEEDTNASYYTGIDAESYEAKDEECEACALAIRALVPDEEGYYIQDSRGYVGNDMLFWQKGGGYTTNLDLAEVFSKERVERLCQERETDIAWPVKYMQEHCRPAVDFQYVQKQFAMFADK